MRPSVLEPTGEGMGFAVIIDLEEQLHDGLATRFYQPDDRGGTF